MGPTSLHLGSTMTMAAGAKLFVNASSTSHQAISDERRRREKWQLEVGPGYYGRYNSLFVWGEMEEILVITIKKEWERRAVGASNLAYLLKYDRFIRTGDEKGELLEMLRLQAVASSDKSSLGSHPNKPFVPLLLGPLYCIFALCLSLFVLAICAFHNACCSAAFAKKERSCWCNAVAWCTDAFTDLQSIW
jgi:hypothetical protein